METFYKNVIRCDENQVDVFNVYRCYLIAIKILWTKRSHQIKKKSPPFPLKISIWNSLENDKAKVCFFHPETLICNQKREEKKMFQNLLEAHKRQLESSDASYLKPRDPFFRKLKKGCFVQSFRGSFYRVTNTCRGKESFYWRVSPAVLLFKGNKFCALGIVKKRLFQDKTKFEDRKLWIVGKKNYFMSYGKRKLFVTCLHNITKELKK